MSAWDMARLASKRPLRKPYKPVAPVHPTGITPIGIVATLRECRDDDGVQRHFIPEQPANGERWSSCLKCGYTVCSCPAYERPPYGHTFEGKPAAPSGLNSVSQLAVPHFTPEQRARLGME